jgi:hypothetical protein
MLMHYVAEEEATRREQELRCRLAQPRRSSGSRAARPSNRTAAGVARMLRGVADRLDAPVGDAHLLSHN